MTDATIAAIIGGVPATLVALGALIQSIRNGKKADDAAKKAVTAVGKADELAQTTAEIQTKTNGNLSTIREELAVARKEIEGLKLAREVAAVGVALATPVPEAHAPTVTEPAEDEATPPG